MEIKIGRSYASKSGEVWTGAQPLTEADSGYKDGYRFSVKDSDGCPFWFTPDGRFFSSSRESACDLIAEWPEPETAEGATARKLTTDDLPDQGPRPYDPRPLPFSSVQPPDDPVRTIDLDYAPLASVLNDAFQHSASGKGHDRHSAGKPVLEQPILEIARMLEGIDGHAYQIMKKAQEASRMVTREQHNAAVAELYGIINYAAAAVIRIREIETENGVFETGGLVGPADC